MKRASRVPFIVISLLACLAFSNPTGRCATSPYKIINQSGKGLSSLFEGLKPSPLAQPGIVGQYYPASRDWRGITPFRLPGLLPVNIIGGGICPGSEVCSNHFVLLNGSGSCSFASGCSVSDFTTDTQSASCQTGEVTFYFEVADASFCLNPYLCFNLYQ